MSILEHTVKNGAYYHVINRGQSGEVDMALTYLTDSGDKSQLCFRELD